VYTADRVLQEHDDGGRRAAGVAISYSMVGRDQLPAVWVLFFLAAAVLFAYRYRRFWRRFGDGVVPGMRTLPPK
jgi:hypothetical protein